MALVDDASVVGAGLWVVCVELLPDETISLLHKHSCKIQANIKNIGSRYFSSFKVGLFFCFSILERTTYWRVTAQVFARKSPLLLTTSYWVSPSVNYPVVSVMEKSLAPPIITQRVLSGLLYLNGLLDLFDDPVLDAGLTEDVVWGDAGLTTVSVLPPGNTPTKQWQS